MKVAHVMFALTVLVWAAELAAASACPAPPVVTADGAICLAALHMASSASQTQELKYQAEEHKDYWYVVYWPKDTNVRGGGGKLRIDKATGRLSFVEGYR